MLANPATGVTTGSLVAFLNKSALPLLSPDAGFADTSGRAPWTVRRSTETAAAPCPTTPSYAGSGLGAAFINQRSVLYPLWQAGGSLIGVGLGSPG